MADLGRPPPTSTVARAGGVAQFGRDQGEREFSFSSADFERVRKLIYQHAGISLSPVKQDMVYSRLARRLRATGLITMESAGKNTFGEYLDLLEKGGADEWERFVNSLTTNLTSFFREPHHFPIFADHLLKLGTKRPIRIWCSAASTGEEPYSIAITVLETFGANASHVSIFASDLDTNVLARFFVDDPDDAHVMIYFDKPTQYKILSRFAPMMQPDGLMLAGHSESFLHAADLFKSMGKTVYALAKAR